MPYEINPEFLKRAGLRGLGDVASAAASAAAGSGIVYAPIAPTINSAGSLAYNSNRFVSDVAYREPTTGIVADIVNTRRMRSTRSQLQTRAESVIEPDVPVAGGYIPGTDVEWDPEVVAMYGEELADVPPDISDSFADDTGGEPSGGSPGGGSSVSGGEPAFMGLPPATEAGMGMFGWGLLALSGYFAVKTINKLKR